MKKLIFVLAFTLAFVLACSVAFADRDVPTIKGFTSGQLVKRGDWKIYRISFTATASNASFTIYDCLTIGAGLNTNVKTEGAVAVSSTGKNLSFVGKPLEGSTGLFLVVESCNVVIEYE